MGKDVTRFKKGEKVYGTAGIEQGTYAEYKAMSEGKALATMPFNMTYEEAASIPNGALTALPFLRDNGNIRSGQKVLIIGASGAVGTSAVQIAKYYGAEAAVSASNTAMKIFGSYGYSSEYPAERYFRDAKSLQVVEGTSNIQKIIISRNVIK